MKLNQSPEDHLQPIELAVLLERTRQEKGQLSAQKAAEFSPPLASQAGDLHPHLAQCSVCLERFQSMASFDGQLESLKSTQPAARQADCPEPTIWREIAVAITPPDQALTHLQHASGCDHCGPLLREAVTDMNALITESEAKQIAALESARRIWQQKLASRITGTEVPAPLPWWKVWATAPRVALASASLVALAVIGSWMVFRAGQSSPPADLLASAYSEQRPFELRMSGAAYAPLRVQRGAEGSFLSRPTALLKAEAAIASQLGSHPSDPNWLQAKARADLLEGKYDSAVDTLRHALQIAPKSPDLLIDLGTAYFQRGQVADRPEDFGAAYESLSQALVAQPENPVALFNRAIISEHQFLFHQALDDWDHYLRVEPRSEWADEARQHADAVRAKLKEHDKSHAAPLLTPAQIAARISDPGLRAEVDQRVEEYLHEAVRSWLPQAYPDGRAAPDPGAAQALFFLADLTAQQHGDRWLSDLLASSSSPNFSQAVAALATAVKASDASDYDTSAQQADIAARTFAASGDTAGALYASFEQAYSAQQLRHTAICRNKAAATETKSEKYPYWWLQVQLGLEQGVCSGIMGNLGVDERLSRQAMERAQRSGYGALLLRALHVVADDSFESGDRRTAWTLVYAGLARYWSGQFAAPRGYNLYAVAASIAEASELSNLDFALWRDAVDLTRSDENVFVRAAVQSEAARAATAAGQPLLAEQYYKEAAHLYTLVPQSDATRAYRLYSEIQAAQLESRLGRSEDAIGRLTSIQEDAHRLSESFLVETFDSALGQVQLSRQHYPETEQALRPALLLAEHNLSSLHSEEERIKWSKDASPIYLGFAEAKLAQGQTQESLENFEWYLGAFQRAGRGSHSQIGLTDFSRVALRLPLQSRETVIAYGLLPDGLAIWTYDNRGISAHWSPGKSNEVLELAGRLNDLVSDPSSDPQALRRDALSLYRLLIAPVEQRLEGGRTLVIETDESLSKVPFESLVDSSGHYLLERAPIVHSLGMYADDRLRPEAPISADSSALVVASTASPQGSGLVPLPDVASEADTAAAHFHDARMVQSPHVSLKQVEGALQTASVFHFAGHALSNSQQTGLILDDRDPQTDRQRLLDAESLQHLNARELQLAVLSACNTANASVGDSSGFSSVTEAFLRIGVPHVVASRWAVDSEQTRSFVDDFYRSLLSGNSVSDATRAAALKRLSNPKTAHPYYWSAFAAYGRP